MAEITLQKTINFPRNGHVFSSKTELFTYIENLTFSSGTTVDALPIAFRYSGETDNSIHTALAIFYGNDNVANNVSVYEDETLMNIIINGVEGTVDPPTSKASVTLSGTNITVGPYTKVQQPLNGDTDTLIVPNYHYISGTNTINEAFTNVETSLSALTLTVARHLSFLYNDVTNFDCGTY